MIFAISLISSLLTYRLSQMKSFDVVRASSFLTLLFVIFLSVFSRSSDNDLWAQAFFGASFVGMTGIHRLRGAGVLFAGLIFSVLFHFLLPELAGLGGALGFCAFLSVGFCLSTDHFHSFTDL